MDSHGMPPEVGDELQEVIETPKSVDSTYEEIDAPRFFDFTVPDHPSCADDGRSWFCARIGCDQVHEEVDLDALNKSFLHRIVAARSPNVRHRKALDQQASSSTPKFPQSAPAKSTHSMLVKLSTIITEKMAKGTLKDHPIASLRSTSYLVKTRAQPCSSKEATTSLRSQRILANQERIQNIKHQKEPVGDVKNTTMSKAVSFVSSDSSTIIATKERSEATSPSNCNVPASEVYLEKKNLKAGRRMKYVPSRYLCTSATWKKSKTAEDFTKTWKKDKETKRITKLASTTTSSKLDEKADKELDGQSVTGFEEHLPTLVVNSDKNSTDMKSDTTSTLTELTVFQESTRDNSNDMEVDREWGSQCVTAAKDEEHLATSAVNSATVYPKLKYLDSAEVNSISSKNIREMKNFEKDIDKICFTCASNKSDIGAQNKDDKENSSYTICGRLVTLNTRNLESKSFNSANRENVPQKTLIPQIKSSNEISDRGKHTKTTNPRPFRLRVDERKILKEANHERLEIEAQKKTRTNVRCGDVIKSVITKEKTTEKIQSRLLKPSSRQTLKHRSSISASRKPRDDNTETVVPGKLSSRQSLEHRSVTASRKPPDYNRETVTTAVTLKGRTASRKSLDHKRARANKKTANTAVILKGRTTSRKPPDCKIARGNRETVTTALTLDVWKRPATVPKEPKFHKIHLPKDCSKRKAEVQIR